MANPLIDFGVLNKALASVTWQKFPFLTVTQAFLSQEGVRLAITGEAVTYYPVNAGMVPSIQLYQPVDLTIGLLKTQNIAQQYRTQWLSNSRLGKGVVRVDVDPSVHPPYNVYNMSITNIREISTNGTDASWVVTCRGYMPVNLNVWP